MGRIILQLASMACLVILIFTDLDFIQRLLLTGVVVPAAIAALWEPLNAKA
jgi:hypothetical protein